MHTTLPDRAQFYRQIAQLRETILPPAQTRMESFGLVYVEIQQWQDLAQRLGPVVFANVLSQVIGRLQSLNRREDTLAQIKSAGFAYLVRDSGLSAQQKLLGLIDPTLSKPIQVDALSLHLRFGMGASRYPDAGITPHVLLEVAMRQHYVFGNSSVVTPKPRQCCSNTAAHPFHT